MSTRSRRGLTLAELATLIGIVFTLIALALAGIGRRRGCAKSAKDAAQLRQIHTALANYAANDPAQMYLRPGLLASPQTSGDSDSQTEDCALNHSAPLYSALIAQNYLTPDILISPIEVNDAVDEKMDYDWGVIDPAGNILWDASFAMRLDDPRIGANGSYAHLAICGDRRTTRWRDGTKTASNEPVLANRGVRNGVTEGDDYVKSPTLQFHDADDRWVGNVVYNDNHTSREETFYPPAVSYEPPNSDVGLMKDNIFAAEFDGPNGPQAESDTYLGVFTRATEFTVTPVFDPLD